MPVAESLSILLIEGRGGIARALLSTQAGFIVTHADRMAKVSALAAQARSSGGFAAALIDLSLPDSPGIEGFRRLMGMLPGVPVVVLSRGGDPGLAEQVISEGAQACLDKDGLDGGALAQALRQAVVRSRAEALRFKALFDTAPMGIMLAAGRRVIMANPAALEILDAGPGEIQETRFAAELQRPDGTTLRCQAYVTAAVVNDAPAVALYLASLEDKAGTPIAASDAAEGAEESADEGSRPSPVGHILQGRKMDALERLAGGIAHDFNNLLTAINGYSEHLLTMPGATGSMESGLKAIRRAGETAAAMTRSLMSFSRTGNDEARPVPVDASILEMAPMLRRLLGARVELRVEPGAGTAAVLLEPGQLEQVILNLCVNARDAMPQGGVLTLSTSREEPDPGEAFTHMAPGNGPHVIIKVGDTGTGMGRETLECLFEPFFTTKQGGRGTGLGLATVYGIVSAAHGGIDVSSGPGEGSVFRIFLAVSEVEAEKGIPASEPVWKSRANSETVLVVEDEPSLREMIVTILERFGFKPIQAATADEAEDIVAARADEVDLVVTDVMLRGEGGHELAETLQVIKPGLRTVFISGHSLESLADRDIIVPADAFLEKPFTPAQLAAKVRFVLDSARKTS
jgi:two-component system, cell cycle sensor histidine kinase and response regulator CckA